MTRNIRFATILGAVLAFAAPAAAQQTTDAADKTKVTATAPAAAADQTDKDKEKDKDKDKDSWKNGRTQTIQYLRPQDKRGLNVFETTNRPGWTSWSF